jgi:hypothetical protein
VLLRTALKLAQLLNFGLFVLAAAAVWSQDLGQWLVLALLACAVLQPVLLQL